MNNTIAQTLAIMVHELQHDCEMQLPHVFVHNNSVSAVTGLAPNKAHMGRLPRFPLTISDRTGVPCHQPSARDHLAHWDLVTDASSALKISTVNTVPSQIVASNTEI